MAVDSWPTMDWTMWSGTPALAASDTKVCRSEWKVASGVLLRRPSNWMDVTILAALKIFAMPWLILHRDAIYASAIKGITKPSRSFTETAFSEKVGQLRNGLSSPICSSVRRPTHLKPWICHNKTYLCQILITFIGQIASGGNGIVLFKLAYALKKHPSQRNSLCGGVLWSLLRI